MLLTALRDLGRCADRGLSESSGIRGRSVVTGIV